jgi:DNA repair protein RadA/Sms
VAIGEVGLLGELRPVGGLDRRLREAARLGFTRAIVPRAHRRETGAVPGIERVVTGSLADAIRAALDGDTGRRDRG